MPLMPRALRRAAGTAVVLLLAAPAVAGLVACGGSADEGASFTPAATASPTPAATAPATGSPLATDPAAGTRLAPGLYDLEDGAVVAVGTVEYRELEGGFWAVVDGTAAEGDEGAVVAVIVNGAEFEDRFRENPALSFEVYGERAGEASIRMAGPEIVADRVVLAAEGGPAE